MRMNDEQLRAARLSLNTPDGFAISKAVIIEMIDELLELRARVCDEVEAKRNA